MRGGKKRFIYAAVGTLLVFIGGVLIWFRIPYAPLKKEFQADLTQAKAQQPARSGVFTRDDIAHLPAVLQRYLDHCGYIGTPKMRWMTIHYEDVAFLQSENGPALTIDYTQLNTVAEPCRLALVDSSLYGVPFQGYDYYADGRGGMKGVIAKGFTLFDQRGTEMDRAALVTYLAESLFAPTILLQENVTLEALNDHQVRAGITAYGQTVSGIFTFNDRDEMIRFTTDDRSLTNDDGTMTAMPWSALCDDYRASENGILHPTTFRAVWNKPEGDFIYFDGQVKAITYDD